MGTGLGSTSNQFVYTSNGAVASVAGHVIIPQNLQFQIAEVKAVNLKGPDAGLIGQIEFRLLDDSGKATSAAPAKAFPINSAVKLYPVIGETVYVLALDKSWYYASAINSSNYVNNNLKTGITNTPGISTSAVSTNYKDTTESGIANIEITPDPQSTPGKTFKNLRNNIGMIRPNEGDYVISGRFGNNIHLGNNPTSNFPNIKIGLVEPASDSYTIIEEILDRDTSIWLTSDEVITFKPSGIPINPDNEPPNAYKGSQIAIFGDRLIFNAKKEDMILMSNRGILLTSNKNFSVDSNTSILLTAKNTTAITSKNIYLGAPPPKPGSKPSKEVLEALVLGNTLVEILGYLLDELAVDTHPSPAGDTGPSLNASAYKDIKNQLKTALSKRNYTL